MRLLPAAAAPACLGVMIVAVVSWSVLLTAQSLASEDLTRRQYESGLEFQRAGKYAEALKDFQGVVDGYPSSSVADDALLAIARYQLDVLHDSDAARTTAESVSRRYPASDSVPLSYVIAGEALAARGLTPATAEAALASFDRVQRLFPGTDAVGPALVAAGDTLRRLGRCPEALERFDQVTMAYPRSTWASAARLSEAACLATGGRPLDAMEELERVIVADPASIEARQARTLNTIIYRLYVRPPDQSPYAFAGNSVAGPSGKLKGVSALAFGPDGVLFVSTKTGIVGVNDKGAAVRSVSAIEPRALFVDERGRVLAAQRALLVQEATPSPQMLTLTVPRESGIAKVLDDISAVAMLTTGERLVADRAQRGVFRFDPAGKFLGPFAPIRASRIAVGPTEQIALLDRDNKAVSIVDRTGKQLVRVAARGTGYELINPADIAFDVLGHLYVLDAAQVVVFAPDGRFVTTFAGDKASAGAMRAGTSLALDTAARLYIYDDRAERVQIYE